MAQKAMEKYGFKGELAEAVKVGDLAFDKGQVVEFGPYDTSSRRDAEMKKAAAVFAGEPELTVILTCSSVAAFAEAVAPKQPTPTQAVAKQEAPKAETPKPTARRSTARQAAKK